MKKLIFFVILLIAIAGCIPALADTAFTCVVTKGEWVWMRSAPSKEATQVDTIRYGVEGEIHTIENGYADITTADGRTGWVDVSYLLIPIKEEVWVINTDGPLNKRETPNGRYLTRIKGGSRISVLGWRYDSNGELWAYCYKGGYVSAKFLSKAD